MTPPPIAGFMAEGGGGCGLPLRSRSRHARPRGARRGGLGGSRSRGTTRGHWGRAGRPPACWESVAGALRSVQDREGAVLLPSELI